MFSGDRTEKTNEPVLWLQGGFIRLHQEGNSRKHQYNLTIKIMTFHQRFPKRTLLPGLLAMICMSFQACSDDDDYSAVDNQAPTLELATQHIQTEPNRQFTIAGLAKDADGLKSITLKSPGMNLDKTIDLLEYYPDTLLHEYQLSYNYKAQSGWTDTDRFAVQVTVEDVLGHTVQDSVIVTPDGDFTNPVFSQAPSSELTVLLQNPNLSLTAAVTDNKNLKYIKVSIPGLDIADSISITGTAYTFTKTYTMPDRETSYEMTITVGDQFDNTTSTQSVITVSDLPDFDKMYLADVTEASQLTSDVYGVPMLIDHVGQYQYRALYYNQKAGTGIRFIPQKTDFQPICFGIDPSTGLLTSNPSVGEPIQLDKVGYYQIDFNTVSGEYDVKTYTPGVTSLGALDGSQTIDFKDGSGTQAFTICLAGSGLPGTPSWTTNPNNDAFVLQQDKTNPYLLYKEMTLTAGNEVSFTISATHIWGWWPEPYWRFDGSAENEKNVKNGGDNMKGMKVPADGTYRFEFDYALLRSRIIRVK